MHNPWLNLYTVVVAFCTLLLVVAGGLVTSNDAGLSVPDWPLSYGDLKPYYELLEREIPIPGPAWFTNEMRSR